VINQADHPNTPLIQHHVNKNIEVKIFNSYTKVRYINLNTALISIRPCLDKQLN